VLARKNRSVTSRMQLPASVTAFRSVTFGVADLDASSRFYEDVWHLAPVARAGGAVYFRASGDEHHTVVLRETEQPVLVRADFAAADRVAVDALYEQVARAGGRTLGAPAALDEPGNGYGFTFVDPEGRTFAVTSDVERHPDATPVENRPNKMSHLVLNAADTDAMVRFFREALGFRLRDQTARMDFLGCNRDHHSVAITRMGNVSLNHVAFEVPDLDSLMRGTARVRRAGCELEWGIGRHGPGSNIFAYFCDPNDLVIEYTTAIDQVDDATYRAGTPADWTPPIPGNPDYWGFAQPPSERFERASGATHPAAPTR
jgi:catechol 2,3-dioxygenase-like lactoylglutathione lyase family enzyme